MLAETALVAHQVIDIENVVLFLILADAKTCPLLKEYSMSCGIQSPRDVLNSKHAEKLKESSELMQEIILAGSDVYAKSLFSVDSLRRKLSAKGLGVCGSKEALVSRLEQY